MRVDVLRAVMAMIANVDMEGSVAVEGGWLVLGRQWFPTDDELDELRRRRVPFVNNTRIWLGGPTELLAWACAESRAPWMPEESGLTLIAPAADRTRALTFRVPPLLQVAANPLSDPDGSIVEAKQREARWASVVEGVRELISVCLMPDTGFALMLDGIAMCVASPGYRPEGESFEWPNDSTAPLNVRESLEAMAKDIHWEIVK